MGCLLRLLLAIGLVPQSQPDGVPTRLARRHSALLHYGSRRLRHG